MLQQPFGESCRAATAGVVHPEIRLRHHGVEKSSVSAKSVGVGRAIAYSRSATRCRNEPFEDLVLVEIDRHMQQRRTASGVPIVARTSS